jgi:catechol 2,3-dioxygenase-like lactoylglutathione lyase family enzyme
MGHKSTDVTSFPTLRIARPSDDLGKLLRFYRDGLGLTVLYQFEDHDGFDGLIVGGERAPYHLEFTSKRHHLAGRAPTEDNLLVFYYPDVAHWGAAIGFTPVRSFNPFWDCNGTTFEDPDGYRIVLQNASWDR